MKGTKPNELYNADIFLQAETINHERKIYALFDLLGDIGGVMEFLVIGFSLFILPFAEHLFILAATKEIFLAKTADEKLLKVSKKEVQSKQ